MDVKHISQVIGRNFFDVFKPNGRWQEIVNGALDRLSNGESPEDVFDYVGDFREGLAVITLNDKCNWVRQDNGQLLSNQWYNRCASFREGLAKVELNDKWNWIRADNGQLLSNQWYDRCAPFREGFAVVEKGRDGDKDGKYN
jgi:hypothetical protein